MQSFKWEILNKQAVSEPACQPATAEQIDEIRIEKREWAK